MTGRITVQKVQRPGFLFSQDEAKGGEESVFDHPVPQVSVQVHVVKAHRSLFQPQFGFFPVIVTSAAATEEPQPCVKTKTGARKRSQGLQEVPAVTLSGPCGERWDQIEVVRGRCKDLVPGQAPEPSGWEKGSLGSSRCFRLRAREPIPKDAHAHGQYP